MSERADEGAVSATLGDGQPIEVRAISDDLRNVSAAKVARAGGAVGSLMARDTPQPPNLHFTAPAIPPDSNGGLTCFPVT